MQYMSAAGVYMAGLCWCRVNACILPVTGKTLLNADAHVCNKSSSADKAPVACTCRVVFGSSNSLGEGKLTPHSRSSHTACSTARQHKGTRSLTCLHLHQHVSRCSQGCWPPLDLHT
jgi:hypothetical protein